MSKDTNPKEALIKAAYADVHKFGSNQEYDKAVKAVNRSKFNWHVTSKNKLIIYVYLLTIECKMHLRLQDNQRNGYSHDKLV